jgi:hypothetical protein
MTLGWRKVAASKSCKSPAFFDDLPIGDPIKHYRREIAVWAPVIVIRASKTSTSGGVACYTAMAGVPVEQTDRRLNG